jgi:hypothetical protein
MRLGQEVVAVNLLVAGADAVYATEALNEPHRVPMQVVVDDLVAVLQIQTLGENVGRYELGELCVSRTAPLSPLRATENTRSKPLQLFSKQFLSAAR